MAIASNQVADATEDIVEKMDTVCQQLSSINGEVTKISQTQAQVHGCIQGHGQGPTGSASLRDGTIESFQSMKDSVVEILNESVGKIEQVVETMNDRFDAQSERIGKIEETQAANHEKLLNLDQSVQSMKASMGEMKDMINALSNQLTLQTKKQQQQPVIGQALSRERLEYLLLCEDAWQSFKYYVYSTRRYVSENDKGLMRQILQLFAAGAGYNIPVRYRTIGPTSKSEIELQQDFKDTLVKQLKWLIGHTPQVEKKDDGTYTLYYA